VTTRRLVALGLLVSVLVAGVLSSYASSRPDGLTFVARSLGFADTADYSVSGVTDARLSGGLAGVIGVAVVGLLMAGLVLLLRRRSPRGED
jgi:uncharacterized membrane protein YedE/YeeE